MKNSMQTIKISKYIWGALKTIKMNLEAGEDTEQIVNRLEKLMSDLYDSIESQGNGLWKSDGLRESFLSNDWNRFTDEWRKYCEQQNLYADYDELKAKHKEEIKALYRNYFQERDAWLRLKDVEADASKLQDACKQLIKHPEFNNKCSIFHQVYAVFRLPELAYEYVEKDFWDKKVEKVNDAAHQLAKDDFWGIWKEAKTAVGITPDNAELVIRLQIAANHLLKFEPNNEFVAKCTKAEMDPHLNEGKGGIRIGAKEDEQR